MRAPVRRFFQAQLLRTGYRLVKVSDRDRRYEQQRLAAGVPEDERAALTPRNPRLVELERRYAAVDLPVRSHAVWTDGFTDGMALPFFRGDSPYVSQYRSHDLDAAERRFLAYAHHVRSVDEHGLLDRLGEDGAYGCYFYDFDGIGRVSRDLLDSVLELDFLHRYLGLLDRQELSVLDIGAGYGRLAHRTAQAVPGLVDYACVDAVAVSSFLCEYHLARRGVAPPTRMVPLDELGAIEPGSFDLAVNVHSFSECTYDAIEWWLRWLHDLEVPHLLIVPNDSASLLSMEEQGRARRDFTPLLAAAGFELRTMEPVVTDPFVEGLLGVRNQLFLFDRR